MGKNKIYQYYVEGECEEKLIRVLKSDLQMVVPGKIQKFNVVQEILSRQRLMQLKPGTTVVLVFDTDTTSDQIFRKNLTILKQEINVKEVLCIPQVKNLEDELVRSCAIKQIKELLGSKTNEEFKHDLQKYKNIDQKLIQNEFDFNKFWSKNPDGVFSFVVNDAPKIKSNTLTR